MTLSRFLRDYLYIPLGGSRGGRLFTYRNLMITMVLGGLWHGAAWTFVLWGAFQGVGLVSEHALGGRIGRRTPAWLRWFVTFNLIVFGWILFRSHRPQPVRDLHQPAVRRRAGDPGDRARSCWR